MQPFIRLFSEAGTPVAQAGLQLTAWPGAPEPPRVVTWHWQGKSGATVLPAESTPSYQAYFYEPAPLKQSINNK